MAANTGSSSSDSPPLSQQPQSSASSSTSTPQDDTDTTATVPVPHSPAAAPAPQQPPAASPRHPMTTRSRNNIIKPTIKYNNAAQVQCDPHWIPTTWQQAMKHAHWRAAMSKEFNSTKENYTWDLVAASKRMNIVGCCWVFTIKYNPDGSIDKYKARIVAKGYHQQPGVDYTHTFSSVIKSTTIRIILGLAVN